MAQTGYTPILIYSSSTGGNTPAAGSLTNSTLGSELAINITDGKLFYKDNANAVQVIGWKTVPTSAGGTGLTSYTAGDLLYYASGTTLTKLGIGTAYYMLGVNSGGTAPSWQPSSTSTLTAQGDLLYASAANTLARLAKNTTATRYLSNTGTSNNPAWAQIDLSNGVTGTLPVANGGTGLSSGFQNGITEADEWRLNANTGTVTSGTITANLERVDTAGFGKIGTGMSQSSGVFTFPSTGVYLIQAHAQFYSVSAARQPELYIYTTTDNTNYVQASSGIVPIYAASSLGTAHTFFIFNVTSTANCKVRFDYAGGDMLIFGNTSANYTYFEFIRLGDA